LVATVYNCGQDCESWGTTGFWHKKCPRIVQPEPKRQAKRRRQ